METTLTQEDVAALEWKAEFGKSGTIVNIEGQPLETRAEGDREIVTAESFLRAHIEAIKTHYRAEYMTAQLTLVQPLGEVMIKLPQADQEELRQSLVAKAQAQGIDTSKIT